MGFDTTSPAAGSWSGQLEGLDASSILAVPSQPGAQADPVGGVGPTNANGVGQYLEFAGSYTQAFDRATGSGIFASTANGTAAPQLLGTLFAPSGSSYCSNPSLDGFASYDRIDEVFVLGNIFRAAGTGGTTLYYLCFGVSAGDGPVPQVTCKETTGRATGTPTLTNLILHSPRILRNRLLPGLREVRHLVGRILCHLGSGRPGP